MLDRNALQCPVCRSTLTFSDMAARCPQCNKDYEIRDGVPIFYPDLSAHAVSSHQQPKSALRSILKHLRPPHHSLYYGTLSPSYGEGKELTDFLKQHPEKTVLNIGSLSIDLDELHPHIINLDISHYPSIDIVADAHELPFKDNSIDIILFKNVLEHIRDPIRVMAEIKRVLKPGGFLYFKVPFLQPFHAVPEDYQRYSVSGIEEMMKDYEKIEFGISVGPGSMMSWMMREFLAILTSGGNYRAYELGLIVWGWLTFWIKYTDFLFRKNALANRIVSAFYGVYRKK
jgi:SAM-dependent methyltransferase/uncharacterized protein YbaR (Trm112 family)